jgi:hypothetical protein
MWVQEKMVSKPMLFKNILSYIQGLKCGKGVYELEDHVGQKTFSSNLLLKLGLVKKIPFTGFPTCLLENV